MTIDKFLRSVIGGRPALRQVPASLHGRVVAMLDVIILIAHRPEKERFALYAALLNDDRPSDKSVLVCKVLASKTRNYFTDLRDDLIPPISELPQSRITKDWEKNHTKKRRS